MRARAGVGTEEKLILALQRFRAQERIDRQGRQIGKLDPLLAAQTLVSEKGPVGQGDVGEIPGVRMLSVQPAEPAFELPPFDLKSPGKGRGHQIRFLKLRAVIGDRDSRVHVEIGVHGRKKEELSGLQIESPSAFDAGGGESRNAALFQLIVL